MNNENTGDGDDDKNKLKKIDLKELEVFPVCLDNVKDFQ